MAKKIRIEEDITDVKKESTYIKKNKRTTNDKNRLIASVSIMINIILVIAIIVVVVMLKQENAWLDESYYKNKKEYESKIDSMYEECAYVTEDSCKEKYSTEIEKAEFLDESIVFEVKELGNYYYTYDCMMKKAPSEFTYWAYNIEAAKSEGLKKGTC